MYFLAIKFSEKFSLIKSLITQGSNCFLISINLIIASFILSAVTSLLNNPLNPGLITSSNPPTGVPITGVPHAMASSITLPKDSSLVGKIKASEDEKINDKSALFRLS